MIYPLLVPRVPSPKTMNGLLALLHLFIQENFVPPRTARFLLTRVLLFFALHVVAGSFLRRFSR